MRFDLHPLRVTIKICLGTLFRDGEEVGAVTHGDELLVSGDVKPHHRLKVLFDQLRLMFEDLHGPLRPEGVAAFMADMTRQLMSQGGEPTLRRLTAEGVVDAGAAPDLAADPVGCECGKCGTRHGAHQIATSGAEYDAGAGALVVKREVECEFCNETMSWTEGATTTGRPNGRVVAGPFFSRAGKAAAG